MNNSAEQELYRLWVLLYRVTHLISSARNQELARSGISIAEAGVLTIVYGMNGKATPTGIARQLSRQPHTISSQVDRMRARGLLNKANDPDRKNVVRLSLTEKGRAAYLGATRRESVTEILSSLSQTEQKYVLSALRKLQKRAKARLTRSKQALLDVTEEEVVA